MKRTVTVEGVAEIDEREVEWEAQCSVVYRPARVSGPPEDCYPDESEVDILALTTIPPGFENKIDEEEVCDKAWEEFHSGD